MFDIKAIRSTSFDIRPKKPQTRVFIYYRSIIDIPNEYCLVEGDDRETVVSSLIDMLDVREECRQFVAERTEGIFICDITNNLTLRDKLNADPHNITQIVHSSGLHFSLITGYNS